MITNISIVNVFVRDQDEAKRFYVDVLGFEEKDDIRLGDYRWCTVVHPAQPELQVNLSVPGPPHSPAMVEEIKRAMNGEGMAGLGLTVDDCRATVADLEAKGVEFVQEPTDRPYGVEAVCRDNSSNWMVLVEQKEYSAADFG